MKREIVLLAKSKKYHNCCVAGLDIKSNKLVRLISKDNSIHNAIKNEYLRYHGSNEVDLLDIVQVDILSRYPSIFQPENILVNDRICIINKGVFEFNKLAKYKCRDEYIFYNMDKRISREELCEISVMKKVKSLILIHINYMKINIIQWRSGKRKVYVNFKYNNKWYNYMPVTDLKFLEKTLCLDNGVYNLYNSIYLLISLGEQYSDGCHYKLISGVMIKDFFNI